MFVGGKEDGGVGSLSPHADELIFYPKGYAEGVMGHMAEEKPISQGGDAFDEAAIFSLAVEDAMQAGNDLDAEPGKGDQDQPKGGAFGDDCGVGAESDDLPK